jgi:hypothetical protein
MISLSVFLEPTAGVGECGQVRSVPQLWLPLAVLLTPEMDPGLKLEQYFSSTAHKTNDTTDPKHPRIW